MQLFNFNPQPPAYLLVSHGSRDPRPQLAVEKLAKLVSQKLGYRPVGTATLELATQPLHQQIREFSDRLLPSGYRQIKVLPLFLLPGVHVMEDIPAELELARQVLGNRMAIAQCPYLGSHPGLDYLLATQINSDKAWILMSHGSRRVRGNQPVEDMASKLGIVSAYWSVMPTLESRIAQLAAAGNQQIGILPYFLFSGGTTEAIAQLVIQLQAKFENLQLTLGNPLDASDELADTILELI